MERRISFEWAMSKCMELASRGEVCSFDIEQKLKRWGLATQDIDKIIDRLIDEKYVDDQRFAEAYVRDKTRFNHWGRIKTTMMLRQKRVSQSTINKAFDELDVNEYYAAMEHELLKKMRQHKALPKFERNQKSAYSVIQKGFEPSLVFDSICKVEKLLDDEENN